MPKINHQLNKQYLLPLGFPASPGQEPAAQALELKDRGSEPVAQAVEPEDQEPGPAAPAVEPEDQESGPVAPAVEPKDRESEPALNPGNQKSAPKTKSAQSRHLPLRTRKDRPGAFTPTP
ncbi:MAG: hypothetical protein KKB30_03195 [Proteobacteria bacterium]|nr:hypothetical protein [Pseudomonadota bacterium]